MDAFTWPSTWPLSWGLFLALLPALLGLMLLLGALVKLLRRRLLAGGFQALFAIFLIALGGIGGGIALNLHTYERMTAEQQVARLVFARIGPQLYNVDLSRAGGGSQRFELRGDEWQVDARFVRWHGRATLLGLDPLYRLERLSGRYADIARELEGPRTVHGLAEESGLDVLALLEERRDRLPWVDSYYGSATYLPMADGAAYEVHVTRTGLAARPANEVAERAVRSW